MVWWSFWLGWIASAIFIAVVNDMVDKYKGQVSGRLEDRTPGAVGDGGCGKRGFESRPDTSPH